MSEMKIRAILSDDVAQVKEKLGIDSYTWGEHSAKLAEALAAGVDLATYISNGTNADDVAKAGKQATKIRSYAFYGCSSLTTADFPKATSISNYAFQSCSALTTANFPKATSIGSYAFYRCSALMTANFPVATSISNAAFCYCSRLTALILRNTVKICTLSNTNAFTSSAIRSGTGYIYVPSALVVSYKAATNWSTYENQFRALEDYTVDGTTTGALDSSKI